MGKALQITTGLCVFRLKNYTGEIPPWQYISRVRLLTSSVQPNFLCDSLCESFDIWQGSVFTTVVAMPFRFMEYQSSWPGWQLQSILSKHLKPSVLLTHWGQVMHICVGNLTIIGPDNGLSPGRRQAIIWTNAGILLIWPGGTNFNEILSAILAFSFKKKRMKVSSAKWRPFCLGLNVLNNTNLSLQHYIQSIL